jgi:predicted MFS family arabinose efflux permease
MSIAAPATQPAGADDSVVRWSVIVAAGMFASNLAMPDLLDLPIKHLLRTELKLGRDEVSLFLSLAGLPWYFKILAGLLSDCFPLFGTRRKHYLIFSGTLAGVFWLTVGAVPHDYWPLFFALMATHAMLVLVSTVTAALIVEAGKQLHAEGRLVTVRIMVESVCGVVAGPLAGLLASYDFGWTGVAAATIAVSVVPFAILLLREPSHAGHDASALREAGLKLSGVLRSRTIWLTALFVALANAPLSFGASLYFHQTEQLGFANIDIGYLNGISAAACLLTATAYGFLRARPSLRILVIAGILCGAIGAFSFVFYRSYQAALVVEIARGVLVTIGALVLMEVAVRATPTSVAAMGFAILMSCWNIGIAVGDYIGAWLVQHGFLTFYGLAATFAALSVLTLAALRLVPGTVFGDLAIDGIHRDP